MMNTKIILDEETYGEERPSLEPPQQFSKSINVHEKKQPSILIVLESRYFHCRFYATYETVKMGFYLCNTEDGESYILSMNVNL